MIDPYKVLGVNPDASDDDIKKAYRNLSRKYHPDANIKNPNKEQAEEKFKEVQQAYEQIIEERERGFRGSYSYDQGAFHQSGGQDARLQAAANYINSRHFKEALHVLSEISQRDALWYFLSGLANSGVGNQILALDHARTAVNLEPNNMQYRMFLEQLQTGGAWYQNQGRGYTSPFGSGDDFCMRLCLLNLFCNCCCLRPF